ncbi:hypothetical protein ACFYU9_33840 [Streptomyces sp. NPDC004327]|uniref:hypothetical protein n=1 Tax=Streptomyces sp. NPDC004327 TaxID=3364699 RepID=UPI0036D01435
MKPKSKIVSGVLLAGAMALGAAGAASAATPRPEVAPTPTSAQGVPGLDGLPLSGNQLSPLGTLLGA